MTSIFEFTAWLNLVGLLLGAAGSLLLALFGLSNLKTISSGSYIEIDESTPEIHRAKRLSNLGVWLLTMDFLVGANTQTIENILA